MRGVCESAGFGFRLPPSASFCKLPSSFYLMQPSYPLLQAVRRFGPISAAFLPVPAGGPRRRVCKAWPHRPSLPEAEEASAWRHRLQFPGPRLTLKCERAGKPAWRSRTCIVPRCHSEEAFRAPHLEGDPLEVGWGFEGETVHAEVTFGCSGAGRSCPFSTRGSAASPDVNEAPRQNLSGGFPEVSVFPDFRSWHRMKSGSQEGLPALPFPYAPPASETSSSAALTTRPPSLGAANAAGEIPPSTLAGWLPLTCARERRVEESPGIRKQVEEQVL